MRGYSCPIVHAGSLNKDFPVRNGRTGKGSPNLPETPKSRAVPLQNSVKEGTFQFLSSIECSRCELQPRLGRVPGSGAGSPPGHALTRSVSVAECTSLRVWKFIKPGLRKKLSVSGALRKEVPTLQVTARALLKDTDSSSLYVVNSGTEAKDALSQEEPGGVAHLMPEPVPACTKVPLFGEA
ncbi:hypothetical protein AAFF_G00384640 [Aldrovandia affinis]|uniref:Uncharacterized protein n=1 Tax=Aldrovandia affinis TaxID=143900 RepID=A0AAD7VYR9_9TELE|nr:hypothetical protein AAFF_G00384640 [Aldrovandia affinis]